MSMMFDMTMSPGKRRLIRRTVANGPYAPPPGTEQFTNVVVGPTTPGANKLQATAPMGSAFVVGSLVVFLPQAGTGTQQAYNALTYLRASVATVAGQTVTFSTAPTDLSASGINFAGLVLGVMPA